VPISAFYRWRQQTSGRERSRTHSRFADDSHAEPALGSSRGAGKANEATPNDENVGGPG
jgi:hypothetical protein